MIFVLEMSLEDLKEKLTCDDISKNQKKKIMKQIKWLESADTRKYDLLKLNSYIL